MKRFIFVTLLMFSGCQTASEITSDIAKIAEVVEKTVKPIVDKVGEGAEAVQAGLEDLRVQRIAAGKDPEAPLTLEDYVLVFGGALTTFFGTNLYRNRTRERDLKTLGNGRGAS